jgi:ferredoxin
VIEPATDPGRVAGILAPELRFHGMQYCRQDCNLCGWVCPTGVIRPLGLAEKNRQVIGIAVVERAECYLSLERECGVCVARCPRGALVDIFIRETYLPAIQVLRERCNGCGACVGICPPMVIRVEAVDGTGGRS